MEILGTIYKIGITKTFGQNGFTKRNVVVETEEQYPQKLLLEFVKDKCALLDNFAEGERVKVFINLRGREYTDDKGKVSFFNSIQGWKIESASAAPASAPPAAQGAPDVMPAEDPNDPLPF